MNGKPCCVPQRDSSPSPPGGGPGWGHTRVPIHDDWVHLPGGTFRMGTDAQEGFAADGEGPSREVTVHPFRISPTTVTNAQFTEFVRATGYITQAEDAGSSFVFYLQVAPEARDTIRHHPHGLPWWLDVRDACWQRPEGPGSHIHTRMDHPVVHVSCNDAQAYCDWAGTRLPTEAEWEYAGRGGLRGKRFTWGDEMPAGEPPCNIFHGRFPNEPAAGWHVGTVPAKSYAPNGFGLHNMAGNVWEWCADWFHPHYHAITPAEGPMQGDDTGRRTVRGGSFLCHDSYCNRYRVAARGSNTPQSCASNQGFRVVR